MLYFIFYRIFSYGMENIYQYYEPLKVKKNKFQNLQTINLMEAYFNFNNEVMEKVVGQHAEKNKLLPKEQYVSFCGHQARHHGLNKRLLDDQVYLQCRPMTLCSNDATSCYDRIIHSIARIFMQKLGMSIQPITYIIVTIQEMEHYIRMGFGDLDVSMPGLDVDGIPFQGMFQGNGSGPVLWLAVSTSLIIMMKNRGHETKYHTIVSLEKDDLIGFVFLDDIDLVEGDLQFADIDISDVFGNMQETIDCWEGGLNTTGGDIYLDKSFAYPISFAFKSSGEYYFEKFEELNHSLSVKNHKDICEALELVNADIGKGSLIMFLTPDGNMQDQLKAIKNVIIWASHIWSGMTLSRGIFSSISTTIIETLEHPLYAITLSRKECNQLMKSAHDAVFPKAKLCCTLPHNAQYDSEDVLGLWLDAMFLRVLTQWYFILKKLMELLYHVQY